MADTSVERIAGLPADGDQRHFIAIDQNGDGWALQWSKTHDCWRGEGFAGGWPSAVLFKGDMANTVVSCFDMQALVTAAQGQAPVSDAPGPEERA